MGRNSVNQYCRSFLKFNQLPELEKGAVVVGAYFNLWQYKYSANSGAAINIAAHRVTGSWSEASVTWNTQPSFESAAMDYKSIGALGTNQWMGYGFDVTKAVRGWYNDSSSNYGIVLKSATESTYAYGTFASSETPVADYGLTDEQYPTGVIYYRNTNGLESYYSYHEQSLGRTGTGYVNDFNGNLVFVHPDEGTSGCLLPLSFSHVYNLNECDRTSRFGKGWRLSFKQELKATGDTDYPYVLIDGDGTSHYFYKDTSDGNKLKDEDGLGLVITQTSSSNYDAYSIIEDKQGMKYIFGQDNFLRQIKDLNGNAQKAQYSPHADGNHIDYIDDPTGARALFTYNTDKTRLDTLMVNNRVTRFAYDSDGHLTGITYPDGKVSTFTYDGDLLVSAATIDGIKMEYQYTTDCNQTRVSQIREVGSSGTTGQCVNITYLDGSRTRFEEAGLDGSISSTADNRTFTYHFNRYGNPVSVSDDEGHTSSYQHEPQHAEAERFHGSLCL